MYICVPCVCNIHIYVPYLLAFAGSGVWRTKQYLPPCGFLSGFDKYTLLRVMKPDLFCYGERERKGEREKWREREGEGERERGERGGERERGEGERERRERGGREEKGGVNKIKNQDTDSKINKSMIITKKSA